MADDKKKVAGAGASTKKSTGTRKQRTSSKEQQQARLEEGRTQAIILDPSWMGSAAAVTGGVFSSELEVVGIPADWKERALKAWEYFCEEPIVSNTINTWRTFAIGDTIKGLLPKWIYSLL